VNIAVIGSRTFENYRKMETVLDSLIEERGLSDITIVSGGARGADTLAERYAKNRGFSLIVKYADWDLGKHAGYLRNQEMAEIADIIIGFHQGNSKGTQHMLKEGADRGIETICIRS
jgi:hypothetical protein